MSLLISMLPLYLFGNLHCIGMCGPLVMMLGKHRYRNLYFLGRICSFTLAGTLAGELGGTLGLVMAYYQVPALTSFFFGALIIVIAFYSMLGWHYPGYRFLARRLAKTEKRLSALMMNDLAFSTFLFGFFTVMLPCGQTMIVFSACALSGSAWTGFINGMAFSLLTSPSLWIAMRARSFLAKIRHKQNLIMGFLALFVGVIACCRGLAELGVIKHWVLNPASAKEYHIVIY
jgi:sulfite exporter TauE/SafE